MPFPRLHFLVMGQAPVISVDEYSPHTLKHLAQAMTSPCNIMVAVDPRMGRYLTSSTIFRGRDLCAEEVDNTLKRLREKRNAQFVDWLPDNLQAVICDVPPAFPPGVETSATFLGNSTAIQAVFHRIQRQATAMLSFGAFIHQYRTEGVEDDDILEALNCCNELCAEYQQYETVDMAATDSSEEEDEEVEENEDSRWQVSLVRETVSTDEEVDPHRQALNLKDAGYETDSDQTEDGENEEGQEAKRG